MNEKVIIVGKNKLDGTIKNTGYYAMFANTSVILTGMTLQDAIQNLLADDSVVVTDQITQIG